MKTVFIVLYRKRNIKIYNNLTEIKVLKQPSFRINLQIKSYIFFKISLQIYIIVVRNEKPYIFSLFCFKTDGSLFCHRDIPTIHNGYCESNAVDYAKKNEVLRTICQLN